MTWLVPLWHLVGAWVDAGPIGLVVGTGAAAAVLLAAILAARMVPRRVPADPGRRVTRAILHRCAGQAGVPRHRDPDAAGRSRPRAPTTAAAVA